jgi:hypothetical protein
MAKAPRPKTTSARPPRATNGPTQAQTIIRGNEDERDTVDMVFLSRRERASRVNATHHITPGAALGR